jgi:hypothetical protein
VNLLACILKISNITGRIAVRLVRIIQIPHLVPHLLRVHRDEFVQLEHIIQAGVTMDQSARGQ